MDIKRIEGMTRDIGKPIDWSEILDGPCQSLPVRDEIDLVSGKNVMFSEWQPDFLDLTNLMAGGTIRLGVFGITHPVVQLGVIGGTAPQEYPIGPLTEERVFKAAGLTNLSDMQAVLDAIEAALSSPPISPAPGLEAAVHVELMKAANYLVSLLDMKDLAAKTPDMLNERSLQKLQDDIVWAVANLSEKAGDETYDDPRPYDADPSLQKAQRSDADQPAQQDLTVGGEVEITESMINAALTIRAVDEVEADCFSSLSYMLRGLPEASARAIAKEALRAALSDSAPSDTVQVSREWSPIETAPRVDGGELLMTGGGLGDRICVVKWCEKVGCWDADWIMLDDSDHESDGYVRPQFWMPIPSAPQLKGGENG